MVRLVLSASLTILFRVAARGQTSSASPATPLSFTRASRLRRSTRADLQRAIPLIRDNYRQSRGAQCNGVRTGHSRRPV